ncbi:hypothetical protein [Azospirillum sp.]|uniref:hypothetical protein n=1 Tax=Azospirillum sp. TaxID=34012 RepID=UPI002D74E09E|nr:hypothetical protein [Azospirillum sp.]HYD70072.1 hypothetical protein [Azospirillum sp.]
MKVLQFIIFAAATLIGACQAAQAGEKVFYNMTSDPLNVEVVVRPGNLETLAFHYTVGLGHELPPDGKGTITYPGDYIEAIKVSGVRNCELNRGVDAYIDKLLDSNPYFAIYIKIGSQNRDRCSIEQAS